MEARRRDAEGDASVAALVREIFPSVADSTIEAMEVVHHPVGTIVCAEGEPAHQAWLVAGGLLRVLRHVDGRPHHAANISPGSIVGEAGLLDGGTRDATVVVARAATLVELDRVWLADILTRSPRAIGSIVRALVRHGDDRIADHVVALVPTDSTNDVVDQVLAEIDGWPDGVAVPASDTGDEGLLAELEATHRTVALGAEATWTERTAQLATMADSVVVFVEADRAEVLHPIEEAIASAEGVLRVTVVLVHPASTGRPSGTGRVLDLRPSVRHLHLRRGEHRHVARVARLATGRATSLVLGGGGARALGEIGAIEELVRRGHSIDAVVGTSAGAVIGAVLALDLDLDETRGILRQGFVGVQRDLTVPLVSVLTGARVWRSLSRTFDDMGVEDLWLPFGCVSTDLTVGAAHHHVRGELRRALRASLSLPGIFPPTEVDGRLHVDGGLLDNLPVDLAHDVAPGSTRVAIDVSPESGQLTGSLAPVVSGWKTFGGRLLGRSPAGAPTLGATVIQSMLTSANRARAEAMERAELGLRLRLDRFGLLAFNAFEQIADEGARQTATMLDHLDDWKGTPLHAPSTISPVPAAPLVRTRRRRVTGALWLAGADLRFRLRRFVVAVVAAAVTLALLQLVTGVVNQLDREPGAAAATIGASHWVLLNGVDNPFTSNAALPEGTLDATTSAGEVRPALVARLPVTVDGETIDAILVGHAADGPGVPDIDDGAVAGLGGEVVVSTEVPAEVGDVIQLGNARVTVTGRSEDATLFAGMPLLFVPIEDARDLVADGRPVVSVGLADGPPASVPDGVHVATSSEVADAAKGPVERPILTLHIIRVLLAIVAAMIIGAVVYLASIERTRDVAVLRAVGVERRLLATGVAAQALTIAALAAVTAAALASLMAPVFPLAVHLSTADVVLLPVTAVLVAGLASYAAIRRTLRIDPSAAFAGAGG